MYKTKIDYATHTWNPVLGCRNSCPYCYARSTAYRWGLSFEPHWRERNFNRAMPKQPARIFVNSMSDVMYWRPEWWARVLGRIRENPQHVFLFLTQDPAIYWGHLDKLSRNCWFGATATNQCGQIIKQNKLGMMVPEFLTFLSIEPMLEAIDPAFIDPVFVKWVILGAETGNQPRKVVPSADWIKPFMRLTIPVFMKHNLPWAGPWRKEYPKWPTG